MLLTSLLFLNSLFFQVPFRSQNCALAKQLTGGIYDSDAAMTGWGSFNGDTFTANNEVSTDCLKNAATTRETNTTVDHLFLVTVTHNWAAQVATATIYAKRVIGTRDIQFDMADPTFVGAAFIIVNLGDCSIRTAGTAVGTFTGGSGTSAAVGSGWCKVTLTATATTTNMLVVADMWSLADNSSNYAGDGVSTNALWGVDLR